MEIKHLVELNGGVFSKDLDRIRSTHLVAIDTTGSKYVHAVTWGNVRVVNKDWIQQCNIAKSKIFILISIKILFCNYPVKENFLKAILDSTTGSTTSLTSNRLVRRDCRLLPAVHPTHPTHPRGDSKR